MILRQACGVIIIGAITFAQPASKDWERSKPEDQGFSSKSLAALRTYLTTLDTTAMIAVHDGKVVFEYGNLSQPGMLTSVRKSMLALLYGNYVANGKINLDATLADLGIDDVGGDCFP